MLRSLLSSDIGRPYRCRTPKGFGIPKFPAAFTPKLPILNLSMQNWSFGSITIYIRNIRLSHPTLPNAGVRGDP